MHDLICNIVNRCA